MGPPSRPKQGSQGKRADRPVDLHPGSIIDLSPEDKEESDREMRARAAALEASGGGKIYWAGDGRPIVPDNGLLRVYTNFHNRGGAARGLEVVISGPLVESDVLDVGELTVFMTLPRQSKVIPVKRRQSQRTVLIATFPDFEISAGVTSNEDYWREWDRTNLDVDADLGEFQVHWDTRFTRPGKGDVEVEVRALAATAYVKDSVKVSSDQRDRE